MRLGFGFDSPSKDSLTGKSPKNNLGSISPTGGLTSEFSYDHLPPVGSTEIEFFVENPTRFKPRESVRSGKMTVGCFTFDVLVFPAGNQTTYITSPKMAVYVEAADVAEKDSRWVYSSVKFAVCIVNQKDYRKSLFHDDSHSFCSSALDRGWPDLLSHSDMTPDSGWLDAKGRLCIRASVCVRQADTIQMGADYDTRKETGFIGLKNHGATCYLNGLLQSYFHIGKFREIVYQMKDDSKPVASGEESPSGGTRMSLPLALQSVFLKLESSETPVNTIELTRAFGWDSMDAFTQHDVQELARILCDKLEERLKGTSMDRAIQDLFEGEVENYIECIDIEYKSTKKESFYDIPVNVRGFTGDPLMSLDYALREFTAVEIMEGDNAYDAESHGRQRARKGIRFSKFPPVLSFQLKRFSFDYEKLENAKLNDRFTFPTELDMNPFLPGAGTYDLHTVLVHSGDVHSGHYYAFIRGSDSWHRFDDEQVSKCSEFAAVDDNFGGEDVFPYNYLSGPAKRAISRPRIHSAYMLVYMKRDRVRELLVRPSISEVQARVLEESRKIDERKRAQEEAKQMLNLAVVNLETDLIGKEGFGLGDFSDLKSVKIRRDFKVADLGSELGGSRTNHTALFYLASRGNRWTLLAPMYQSASTTPKSSRLSSPTHFKFPVSEIVGDRKISDFPEESDPLIVLPIVSDIDRLDCWTDATPFILVTLKWFDVRTKKLSIIAVKYIHCDERISSLIPWLVDHLALTDLTEDPILAFDEDSLRMLELAGSFSAERIGTGSIIVFQLNTITEAETEESSEDELSMVPQLAPPAFTIRTVADFAHSLNAKVSVQVVELDASDPAACDGILATENEDVLLKEQAVCRTEFSMDTRWNLRVVVSEIKKRIKFDSNHRLEIYAHNPFVTKDAPLATSDDLIRVGRVGKLGDVVTRRQPAVELYAVCVPIDSICVRFFSDSVAELDCAYIDVHRMAEKTVSAHDLVVALRKKNLYPDDNVRIAEVYKSQIVKLYGSGATVDCQVALCNVDNRLFEFIRIEPGSDQAGIGKVWLFVSHVDKGSGLHFGYPFAVAVDSESTARQVRGAIQEKLKQTGKWRLCVDVGQRLLHLKDDDVISSFGEVNGHLKVVLEHSHPNPEFMGIHKTSGTAYKPLTIRG